VFLDLDDTIFQTRPKCPPGERLHPAAFLRDGSPFSFMTERQQTLLRLLSSSATIIPTTARNHDAFRRVDLQWESLAVLDFGGAILLPDGRLDAVWDGRVRPKALRIAEELRALRDALEDFNQEQNLGIRVRVIDDFDMPLYVVAKHPEGDLAALETMRGEMLGPLDTERFFLHHNDNNLSVVPRFLGKERAVRHILEHHLGGEPILTIGVGDSLSDAAFLDLCDYRLVPQGCQLDRHHRPGREER
jgi:hypothetical protein